MAFSLTISVSTDCQKLIAEHEESNCADYGSHLCVYLVMIEILN
jgi:hypothetical protein